MSAYSYYPSRAEIDALHDSAPGFWFALLSAWRQGYSTDVVLNGAAIETEWRELIREGIATLDRSNPSTDARDIARATIIVRHVRMQATSATQDGGCPKCGAAGQFIRMALCCPQHGAFGGI